MGRTKQLLDDNRLNDHLLDAEYMEWVEYSEYIATINDMRNENQQD